MWVRQGYISVGDTGEFNGPTEIAILKLDTEMLAAISPAARVGGLV